MFARTVSFRLKPNMLPITAEHLTRTFFLCCASKMALRTKLHSPAPGNRRHGRQPVGQQSQRRSVQHQFLPRSVEVARTIYRGHAEVADLRCRQLDLPQDCDSRRRVEL